jgi:DNA modification methylase
MSGKMIRKWEPDNFQLEMNTVWSFPERGDWATHDAKWRGNWSPYISRNLILRYTKAGDWVLDQFAGGGTTLVEAKLLRRNIIGVDINPIAIELSNRMVDFEWESSGNVQIVKGDARNLDFINDESIDLICTHPPYANAIKYSENIEEDLSLLNIPQFLEEMKKVASECFRVLKKNKYCALLIGDMRKKGHVVPLGFKIMKVFETQGFKLKEIIIKEQYNCKKTEFWKARSINYNFLLLAHEYLFVFRK